MTEPLNIISMVCSVDLDNRAHAENTDTQQKILNNHIHHLFNIAFKHIGQTNRIILLNDNGATMAYAGQSEDAVLMAKEILNTILLANNQGSIQLTASVGIHLEPVHVVNDFNQQPNIIGNGINSAKQLVSKARPNGILVSRSFYDNIPPSIQALSTLLTDVDTKHEKQVLVEQTSQKEINSEAASENQPLVLEELNIATQIQQPPKKAAFLNANNWKYGLASVFILVSLFSVIHLATAPANVTVKATKTQPSKTAQPANIKSPSVKSDVNDEESQPIQQQLGQTDEAKPANAKIEVKQKTKTTADSTSKKNTSNKTISWESFKDSIRQGKKHECTQSEIAMNQCR